MPISVSNMSFTMHVLVTSVRLVRIVKDIKTPLAQGWGLGRIRIVSQVQFLQQVKSVFLFENLIIEKWGEVFFFNARVKKMFFFSPKFEQLINIFLKDPSPQSPFSPRFQNGRRLCST